MSILSLIAAIIGYALFFLTEWVGFPVLLMLISLGVALVDLTRFYVQEKIPFSELVKSAFQERTGSTLSVVAAIGFVLLIILY